MKKRANLILFVILVLTSCQKDFDVFERPDWLEGKLYTQLKAIPDIDSFIVCVERSGYDTILDFSGSYTVFAPDNQAILDYMAGKYSSVAEIPRQEVVDLVKYHIIQNPWSRKQLQSLDVNGWIDRRDPANDDPWGYKRQTLLKDDNRKYWIESSFGSPSIVDSIVADELRTVFTPSRKYVPLFFDEYMTLAKLNSADFEDFFGRSYEPGRIFYANAGLYEEDYFAENGFIYKVDQVVNPLKNAEQILEAVYADRSYSNFLNSVYIFPNFTENQDETGKQEGASEGEEVPTLYDLDYNSLVFDIHEELTGREKVDASNTIRYHYGLVAPTNDAMKVLIDNVITDESGFPHWPSYNTTPESIKRIIVNSHMCKKPIYLSDLEAGFVNGEDDSIFIDTDNLVDKIYGSNATFYGTNKAIIPRALSSVAGPVYLRPNFETFMLAIEYANVLPAIKRRNADYAFYVIPDFVFEEDSSLFIRRNPENPRKFTVQSYPQGETKADGRSAFEITKQVLNQIGTKIPSRIPRKEFIPNLGGNFIVYNSEIHPEAGGPTITGGLPCTYGYQGDSVIYATPVELEEPTDNGKTYEIHAWLNFSQTKLFNAITGYPWFYDLLVEAELIDDIYNKFTFISETEYYTVFIPSEQALLNYNTDTLSTEELQQFIKYHFVRGELIFTDGNKLSGEYETLRIDETSTVYNKEYSVLDIRPMTDVIGLYNTMGGLITNVVENDSTTNIMTAIDMSTRNNIDDFVTNGVIHQIDTVLIKR